jgi:hypothetical protein
MLSVHAGKIGSGSTTAARSGAHGVDSIHLFRGVQELGVPTGHVMYRYVMYKAQAELEWHVYAMTTKYMLPINLVKNTVSKADALYVKITSAKPNPDGLRDTSIHSTQRHPLLHK